MLDRCAPRASRRVRLFLASAAWSAIGIGLLAAGTRWIAQAPRSWLVAAPFALIAGWIKGRLVLAARAEANARRIEASDEDRCVFGLFSWTSWGIALVMMAGGMLLRHSSIPRPWLGLIYSAIGVALLTASARSWGYFRRAVSAAPGTPPRR